MRNCIKCLVHIKLSINANPDCCSYALHISLSDFARSTIKSPLAMHLSYFFGTNTVLNLLTVAFQYGRRVLH